MTTTDKRLALIGAAFSNQRELNHKLRPDWHDQGWRYYRAVWTEMAEAIMHTNWAWWKTSEIDAPLSPEQTLELHIELCDVFHFGLSLDIVNVGKHGASETDMHAQYLHAFTAAEFFTEPLDVYMEGIVVDAILFREFNVKKFARVCKAAGLDFIGLLTFYFAKSVLNQFRWANGYKEGKYTKMWRIVDEKDILVPKAEEDNTYLARMITELLATNTREDLIDALHAGTIQTEIYRRLGGMYANVIKT